MKKSIRIISIEIPQNNSGGSFENKITVSASK